MAAAIDPPLPLILAAHPRHEAVGLLKTLLERDGYSVLPAYDGRTALAGARRHLPALVLAAEDLPLLGGLELCRVLRDERSELAIIVLAAKREPLVPLMAFAAGADDCLALPFHPRELLARVRAVLRRIRPSERDGEQRVECGALELDDERRELRARGAVVPLTSLEYELAATFMRHPGRVFSRGELLQRLRGFLRGEPLDRAVDVHVSHLRRKLAMVLGDAVPVETLRGVGYRLRADTSTPPHAQDPNTAHQVLDGLAIAALQLAPIPLLVLAADRTVLFYNDAACTLCGWTPEEVSGHVKCYSLLGCHGSDGMLLCSQRCALHTAALTQEEHYSTRYVITSKDGREIPVAARYSRLRDAPAAGECTLLALQPACSAPSRQDW
jgi:PAS domain S-box-containing protein